MLFIYNIFFLVVLCVLYRSRKKFDISCYLVAIYLVSSLSCTLLSLTSPNLIQYPDRITFESVIVHIFLLSFFSCPFIAKANKIRPNNLDISKTGVKIFALSLIIPSYLAIIASVYGVVDILAFGNFNEARTAYLLGDVSGGYIEKYGVLGYIMSLGPQTCFISVTIFFYCFFYKGYKKLGYSVLIASFALVIQNLSIAGREGIIRWLMYFGFNLILFREYISYSKYKHFWNLFIVCILFMFGVFATISNDRFESSDGGVGLNLLNYLGQPFYNFSYMYNAFANQSNQSLTEILSILGDSHKELEQNMVDFATNVFSTFAGSFIKNVGLLKTLLLGLIWLVICKFTFYGKKTLSFYNTIAYIVLFDVILFGVLYFIHYVRFTQITMVVYIMLASFICKKYSRRYE